MAATPPPPSSPLPEDPDDSLEEIDSLSGKEKFRALQKRLSSSNTMYSSPSGGASLSLAETPPAEPAPPPFKKPHVVDEGGDEGDAVFLDDENVASSRAKKLTHATKDRPRRKVRQPSREKLREQVNEKLEQQQPVQEEPEAISMQHDGSDSPPSFPPLPTTPPPPSETPTASPLVKKQPQASILSSPFVSDSSPGQGNSSPALSVGSQGDGEDSSNSNKLIVIGSFRDKLKKIKQNRASKSGSRIVTHAQADDLSRTGMPASEPIISTTPAKSLEASPVVSLFPKVTGSFVSDTAQHDTNREETTPHKFFRDKKSANIAAPQSDDMFSASPSFKEDDVTVEPNSLPVVDDGGDEDDDDLPSIPPPPIPDLPPPDIMDLTPPSNDLAPMETATVEKKTSFKSKRHSSILQKEVWKQKSDVLEGSMNKPLPLFIQSKTMERMTKLQDSNFNASSESLSSLPDSPPPTLPDSPPPLLPDFPPPLLPDDSNETADDDFMEPETEEFSSGLWGSKDKGVDLPQGSGVAEVINRDSSSLESQPPTPSIPLSTSPTSLPPNPAAPTMPTPTLESPESLPPTKPDFAPPTIPKSTLSGPTLSKSLTTKLPDSTPPTMPESLLSTLTDSIPPAMPKSVPPKLPDSTPPTTPKSLPPTVPDSTPPTMPESVPPTPPDSTPPAVPESVPPTHPDSTPPPTVPDSTPPAVPESFPPTLPESPPPSFPLASPPEVPISPLHSDTQQHSISLSPSNYIKASTPQSQSSNDIQSASLILAPTPSPSFERPPSGSEGKIPTKSPHSSIGGRLESPIAALDDLKSSSSEPNIEPAFAKDAGVQLRKGKQFRPTEYRQSFPLTVHTQDTAVRVISTDSPPASPDLKFTRVSKKIWRRPSDDLSASTGNVTGNTPVNDSTRNPTGSLRSLQSNDSTPLERTSFLQRHPQDVGARQSPLITMTSTPTQQGEIGDLEGSGGTHPKVPPAVPVGWGTESPIDKDKEIKMMESPPKPRQLKAVRRVSDRAKRSSINSFVLDSNLLETEPAKWGLDEVCQWLDLVGLGSFKQAFKERKVDGYMLLHMDVKLFAELGIDSHEMREIFLAKIYELSNPSSSVGGMEDDFLLSVETYNSEDWQKLKAAVNVLKNPVLDDSVLLEQSPAGQVYVKSDSNPSLSNLSENELQLSPTDYGARGHYRRASEGEMLAHRVQVDRNDDHGNNTYPSGSGDMTNDWVAGLPQEYGRRARSYTEPVMPPENILQDPMHFPPLTASKAMTLPTGASLVPPGKLGDSTASANSGVKSRRSSQPKLELGKVSSPTQLSPAQATPSRRTSTQSSAMASPTSELKPEPSTSLQSPTTPETSKSSKLVKIYMSRVQKGSLYKSFIVHPTTTVEEMTVQALNKANMTDRDPGCYCITESPNAPSGDSKLLEPSQCMLEMMNKKPKTCHFELRLKSKVTGVDNSQKPSAERINKSTSKLQDSKQMTRQESIIEHMHSLEAESRELQKQLDSAQLKLVDHQELKKQLASLQDSHATLTDKFQRERTENKEVIQQLQLKLDEASLAQRKAEEQLLLVGSASAAGEKETQSLLDNIQEKYSEEVANLTSEIHIKDKTLQEMRTKRLVMEEEMKNLHKNIEELEKDRRLLKERNQLVHSMDRDMALKEDTIHKLRAEKEQAQLMASQAAALQMSLQTLEVKSKQQQELSSKTVRELKEHLDRLMLENAQKDQLLQAVKKERDRLVRENQAKDALNASLEADVASFEAVQDLSLNSSTRIQKLTRSISVSEVALASLKGEFDKQNAELIAAESELANLRNALSKKDEQLTLLNSINDSHYPRSSLYSTFGHQVPHTLITAQIFPPERDGDEEDGSGDEVGLKVNTFPGEVKGCVIVQVDEHVDSMGLLPGDRVLEINDVDVTALSPREIKELLHRHYKEEEGVRIVVARLISSDETDNEGNMDAVIERYKKLNSSLSVQLETQNAEVDRWRQECNRLKSEILKYSTSQKDKDREVKYLKTTNQDLKQQLEVAEKSAKQLKETLEELDSSVGAQHPPQHYEIMEETLQAREKEIAKIKAAEKARIAELKKLKRERDKAVKTVRQYAVNMEDLHEILPRHRTKLDNLTTLSRAEVTATVHALEKDLAHHKAYLDQLLTVIIDQDPNLLSYIGEAQRMRDKMEDDDSWC